ncbi:helix-turn-helix domain-containing protein [uncultured Roseibium sp.]|uniref:helix-turn-helix domain-containing protein n=1 Tax=uncultured Roseibium sp. TaxID=1936171 RepID=UPI00261F6D6B|nr:helix-turn-helix domain-containing protein [uncultured Roseibium sp.]
MQAGFTDIDGAREFLGNCSVATVYRRIYSGDLTKYKLGKKTLFKFSELENLPEADGPSPAGNDNSQTAAA